jgi:hypothetical protein
MYLEINNNILLIYKKQMDMEISPPEQRDTKDMSISELKKIASLLKINISGMSKSELMDAIRNHGKSPSKMNNVSQRREKSVEKSVERDTKVQDGFTNMGIKELITIAKGMNINIIGMEKQQILDAIRNNGKSPSKRNFSQKREKSVRREKSVGREKSIGREKSVEREDSAQREAKIQDEFTTMKVRELKERYAKYTGKEPQDGMYKHDILKFLRAKKAEENKQVPKQEYPKQEYPKQEYPKQEESSKKIKISRLKEIFALLNNNKEKKEKDAVTDEEKENIQKITPSDFVKFIKKKDSYELAPEIFNLFGFPRKISDGETRDQMMEIIGKMDVEEEDAFDGEGNPIFIKGQRKQITGDGKISIKEMLNYLIDMDLVQNGGRQTKRNKKSLKNRRKSVRRH